MEKPIVLFDGVCNFCSDSINFIIDRDPDKNFLFASLQSNAGKELLEKFKLPTDNFDTVVLVEGEKHYIKTTAALRIVKRMGGAWPLLYVFILVPPFIRNIVYDIVASNRYKWFGKNEFCKVPTPELKERFLE